MTNVYVNKFLNGKKVLFLGDSIMGSDRYDNTSESSKGVPDLVSDYTGATIVNLGIPGSRIIPRTEKGENAITGAKVSKGCLDQTKIIEGMVKNDFTDLKNLISSESSRGSRKAKEAIEKEQADEGNNAFKNFSIIILAYGTNDWYHKNFLYDQTIYNSEGKSVKTGILTTLKKNIDTLQKNFPQSKILILTPIWRYGTADDGTVVWDGDYQDKYGDNYTLKQWASAIEKMAKEKKVGVLNGYEELQLSLNNKNHYFDDNGKDGTHLNYKGNQVYAALVAAKLREIGIPPSI